jgi:dsRNA-specific ribonuclease
MQIGMKSLAGIILVVAALSAAVTKFYFPSIEEKTQTVEKEVVKNNIVTVVKEVTRPDGTKEVITETVDKSTTKSSSKDTVVKYDVTSKYIFGGGVISNFKDKPEYEVSAGMRVFGPVFGQIKYQTNGYVGANLLIEF